MELQAVVMAAGRGSHMTDLTNSVPKPMLPVGNKPLIYYPVNMLVKAGFQEVIVITLESIKLSIERVLNEFKIALKIISIPDDSELDTVDSLHLIKDQIKTDLLIVSCDIVTDLPLHRLVDVHRLHDSTVTMLLCPNRPEPDTVPGVKLKKKGQHKQREFIGMCPCGDVNQRIMFLLNEADLEDETLKLRQSLLMDFPRIQIRTNLHDAHLYIVKRWLLDYIAHNKSRNSFRSELLPYIVQKQFVPNRCENNDTEKSIEPQLEDVNQQHQDIHAFMKPREVIAKEFIFDLSSSRHVKSITHKQLSVHSFIYKEGTIVNANSIPTFVEANRIVSKSDFFHNDANRIHSSAKIHEKSQVGNDSIVGERTEIDEKSSIKRTVIGKECQIGSYTRISNCILMDDVKIGNGCNLQGCVVSGKANVGEKCEIKDCLIGFSRSVPPSSKLSKESIIENSVMMEF